MYAVSELGSTCGKCGYEFARSGADGTHDRVLQGDQRLGGLNFIDCLDLVDKYLLQGIDRAAHHLNKDAVVPGGVIGLGNLVEAFEFGQRGGIVFGALQNNADKAADVVTELFGVHVDTGTGDDARLFHLLHTNMNRPRADAKLFGQFSIGGTGIGH